MCPIRFGAFIEDFPLQLVTDCYDVNDKDVLRLLCHRNGPESIMLDSQKHSILMRIFTTVITDDTEPRYGFDWPQFGFERASHHLLYIMDGL